LAKAVKTAHLPGSAVIGPFKLGWWGGWHVQLGKVWALVVKEVLFFGSAFGIGGTCWLNDLPSSPAALRIANLPKKEEEF